MILLLKVFMCQEADYQMFYLLQIGSTNSCSTGKKKETYRPVHVHRSTGDSFQIEVNLLFRPIPSALTDFIRTPLSTSCQVSKHDHRQLSARFTDGIDDFQNLPRRKCHILLLSRVWQPRAIVTMSTRVQCLSIFRRP
jgi:hypothetical protein